MFQALFSEPSQVLRRCCDVGKLDVSRQNVFVAAIAISSSLYLCYLLAVVVYNVYFHPLSKFPGPIWWGATPIPYVWYQITGRLPFVYEQLHERYGDVVRVLPYKLSFRTPAAWRDIYQIRPKQKLMTKDPKSLKPGSEGVYNIITSFNAAEHSRYHGKLSPAFSAQAAQAQEPIVMHHVDLLMKRLHECCVKGPQNIVKWSNMIYFDIVADLTFGESLHSLEKGEPHSWLKGLFGSTMTMITFHRAIGQFPHIAKFLKYFTPQVLIDQQVKHNDFVRQSVEHRMASKTDRRDFMSYILPYDENSASMSMSEVRATYGTLMLAGSENVATTFSFTIYHLLKNPDAMKKLVSEVRHNFSSADEIDFRAANSLKYISAVVNESMRIHPAAPTSQPRVVPEGGATVAGYWVPEETRVAVPPYCMHHSPRYFKDPESFIPERWLGDPRFDSDNRGVFHPFQLGPRACAGQVLALAELHIVLAKLLWNFDLQLDERCENWDENMKIFHLWQLQPLYVQLQPVQERM
ncbi:MAG: hypothetical protein M1834_003134 [Cirrosporium novae-zelandiae]|nr:MAG: hypothetical protein M1834_003134 [Cirrosporium novae-zelandiae]